MKRNGLVYMVSALAMMAQGIESSTYQRERPKPRRCDQKKCKSCKHFHKTERDCRCSYSGFVNPMQSACGHYAKRKK